MIDRDHAAGEPSGSDIGSFMTDPTKSVETRRRIGRRTLLVAGAAIYLLIVAAGAFGLVRSQFWISGAAPDLEAARVALGDGLVPLIGAESSESISAGDVPYNAGDEPSGANQAAPPPPTTPLPPDAGDRYTRANGGEPVANADIFADAGAAGDVAIAAVKGDAGEIRVDDVTLSGGQSEPVIAHVAGSKPRTVVTPGSAAGAAGEGGKETETVVYDYVYFDVRLENTQDGWKAVEVDPA